MDADQSRVDDDRMSEDEADVIYDTRLIIPFDQEEYRALQIYVLLVVPEPTTPMSQMLTPAYALQSAKTMYEAGIRLRDFMGEIEEAEFFESQEFATQSFILDTTERIAQSMKERKFKR